MVRGGGGTDVLKQSGFVCMIYWDTSTLWSRTNFATNAAGTTLTWSAGSAVTWFDVGRYINITAGAGWTLGRYRIVTINAARSVIIDRSAGSSLTAGTGSLESSSLSIYNHPTDCLLSHISTVYDTTVNAHPASTTIDTNKKFNLALTDLSSDATGKLINSATGGFTADMVGMYLNVTAGAGFVVGRHTIAVYTDANNIQVATSVGVSLTGGTGNVPYTAPAAGKLFITKASTGVAELVPYSSFQNNGSGLVQYTVTAPVQTFSSGDTVKLYDILFNEPRLSNHYTSDVQWRVVLHEAETPVPIANCNLAIKGGNFLRLLNDKSISIESGKVNLSYIASVTLGDLDETAEFAQSSNFSALTFSPSANARCGFNMNNSLTYSASLLYVYNSVIKSSTAYTWFISGAFSTELHFKYSTIMSYAYMQTSGNWYFNRVNMFGKSGLLSPGTWSGVASMSDVYMGDLAGNIGDGGYGTSAPLLDMQGMNIPHLDAHPSYRGYLSFMNTGDGLKFIYTDCTPKLVAADFYGNGSSGKNWFILQCYTRYLKVVDEITGLPIQGAKVTVTSADGSFFKQSYTTDVNGYVNSGASMTQSWTFGSNGTVTFNMIAQRIQLVLSPSSAPVYTTINYSPYTITCDASGYVSRVVPVSLDSVTAKSEQLILVNMTRRRKAVNGR